MPASRALMKLLTSVSPCALVAPSSDTMRFSTLPSAPTRTASARRGLSGTKLSCLSTSSRFGASTTPAAWLRPDSAADAAASASSIGWSRTILRSISRCSRGSGADACMIPSTNRRSPLSVGIRPAEVCGCVSSPRSSSSCITPRIDAGERLIEPASTFEPTGCPRSRYDSTTSPKISRMRSVSSPICWAMRMHLGLAALPV